MPVGAKRLRIAALCAVFSVPAAVCRAGMPFTTFADLPRQLELETFTRMRLEVISFFGLCLLICAAVIRWVWNSLRTDFPILPRLSFARALGLIFVWGTLFVLVLTMISGARELMTPGAWAKQGWTYRIRDEAAEAADRANAGRVDALQRLQAALWAYAKGHSTQLPAVHSGEVVEGIPRELWQPPGAQGELYVYLGGKIAVPDKYGLYNSVPSLVAYEPARFGADRLVLYSDSRIEWLPISEIQRQLQEGSP